MAQKKFQKKFPNNGWTLGGLRNLIRKIDLTGTSKRPMGSGRLVIDAAIDQWRVRLEACVEANGGHFEHNLQNNFKSSVRIKLFLKFFKIDDYSLVFFHNNLGDPFFYRHSVCVCVCVYIYIDRYIYIYICIYIRIYIRIYNV